MLSRTADHLFWMSRYTERAENTARMLNVSYETSLLPQSADVAQKGWEGLLSISELIPAYTARHGEVNIVGRKRRIIPAQPFFLNTRSVLKVAISVTAAVFAQSAMIGSAVA